MFRSTPRHLDALRPLSAAHPAVALLPQGEEQELVETQVEEVEELEENLVEELVQEQTGN